METFSALLAICAGNSPITGEFPSQRPVTRSFDVFFDLRLKRRFSKHLWGLWFETPSGPLWRHSSDYMCHSFPNRYPSSRGFLRVAHCLGPVCEFFFVISMYEMILILPIVMIYVICVINSYGYICGYFPSRVKFILRITSPWNIQQAEKLCICITSARWLMTNHLIPIIPCLSTKVAMICAGEKMTGNARDVTMAIAAKRSSNATGDNLSKRKMDSHLHCRRILYTVTCYFASNMRGWLFETTSRPPIMTSP